MEQIKKRTYLSDYKKSLNKYLLTSRFSTRTWNENEIYRKSHEKIGCIYCSEVPITQEVTTDKIMFVLEMNNDINKIMGIGLIKNHPHINKYNVYENGNYNRYNYVGSIRIDRTSMTQEEETIMKALDILCFKGNTHMKRGHGLKLFPIEMLFKCLKVIDIVDFINTMFKKRLKEKSNVK